MNKKKDSYLDYLISKVKDSWEYDKENIIIVVWMIAVVFFLFSSVPLTSYGYHDVAKAFMIIGVIVLIAPVVILWASEEHWNYKVWKARQQ